MRKLSEEKLATLLRLLQQKVFSSFLSAAKRWPVEDGCEREPLFRHDAGDNAFHREEGEVGGGGIAGKEDQGPGAGAQHTHLTAPAKIRHRRQQGRQSGPR